LKEGEVWRVLYGSEGGKRGGQGKVGMAGRKCFKGGRRRDRFLPSAAERKTPFKRE